MPGLDLPEDILVYLTGSRCCETDRFGDLAWGQFGSFPPGDVINLKTAKALNLTIAPSVLGRADEVIE